MKKELRQRFHYSEDYRRWMVNLVEKENRSILELSREHSVNPGTIYQWLYKYSTSLKKKDLLVKQKDSEQEKRKALEQRIAELERIVGKKQMQIDFLEKMIEIGSQDLGVDLKKNYSTKPLDGSEATKKNTPTD
jgi:transposase-like protein